MADIRAVQLDQKKAKDGVLCAYRGNIRLRIASAETPAYHESLVRILKARKTPDADISDEEEREIYAQLFSEVILVDWENLEENGETVPYSTEKARELLLDRDIDLYEFVEKVTVQSQHFARGAVTKAAGN